MDGVVFEGVEGLKFAGRLGGIEAVRLRVNGMGLVQG